MTKVNRSSGRCILIFPVEERILSQSGKVSILGGFSSRLQSRHVVCIVAILLYLRGSCKAVSSGHRDSEHAIQPVLYVRTSPSAYQSGQYFLNLIIDGREIESDNASSGVRTLLRPSVQTFAACHGFWNFAKCRLCIVFPESSPRPVFLHRYS